MRTLARKHRIELIDGAQLLELVRAVNGTATVNSVPVPVVPRAEMPVVYAVRGDVAAPSCPKCGEAMVRRKAKSGANAGSEFWGCSDYPRCRGIVAADEDLSESLRT